MTLPYVFPNFLQSYMLSLGRRDCKQMKQEILKNESGRAFLCLSLSLVQTPLQYSSVLTHPVFHCFVACYSLFSTAIAPTLMQRHMTCFIFYIFCCGAPDVFGSHCIFTRIMNSFLSQILFEIGRCIYYKGQCFCKHVHVAR